MYTKGIVLSLGLLFFCISLAKSLHKKSDGIAACDVKKDTSQENSQELSVQQSTPIKKSKKKKGVKTDAKTVQESTQTSNAKKTTCENKTPDKKQIKKSSPVVTVKNAITPKMTEYRFWGSDYTPTKFHLSINDKTLNADEFLECSLDSKNCIEITYHYEFQNGVVTGSKCVELEIPTDNTSIDITFSWKNDHRLISSHGRVLGSKKGVMKSSCSFI